VLGGVDSMLVLCNRIFFSFVFAAILLSITGRTKVFRSTLRDKALMRWLIPAAVLVTINWGVFIWAVNSGHVIESSLGYYINPLVVFLLSVLLFRERATRLQLTAIALAFTGVLISVIAYGHFPFISFILALSFAFYGALKKKAHVEPISGIAVETLLISPFVVAFALIFRMDGIVALSVGEVFLLLGSGVVTATPLILYSRSVNHIPFYILGFLQFICPSLMLIYGILSGETITAAQIICFIFIGIGLAVFSVSLARNR
jgi:chloramphenicol-sensitive protein RarD